MKPSLRQQLRARRRALGAPMHALKSRRAAKAILRLPMFACGRRIALYLAFDHEMETQALIDTALRRGIRIYVPVISSRRHSRLRFYAFDGSTRRGVFGIRAPSRLGAPLSARWFNLIVLPLVGVDAHGSRLGMGGGFYDRALAFRRRRSVWRGPHLAGLAFDCQRTDAHFAQSWDVRLDSLATESGLHRFEPGTS